MRAVIMEGFSVDEINRRLDLIQAAADEGDDETAHSLERALHNDTLQAIAEGRVDDAEEAAIMAVSSEDIDFSRHCA
jgi:hypothetical protein